MSLFLVPLAYFVISPLLLVRVRQERRLMWVMLLLLLMGLILSEGVAIGRFQNGPWGLFSRIFDPSGDWLLGPQGG